MKLQVACDANGPMWEEFPEVAGDKNLEITEL